MVWSIRPTGGLSVRTTGYGLSQPETDWALPDTLLQRSIFPVIRSIVRLLADGGVGQDCIYISRELPGEAVMEALVHLTDRIADGMIPPRSMLAAVDRRIESADLAPAGEPGVFLLTANLEIGGESFPVIGTVAPRWREAPAS